MKTYLTIMKITLIAFTWLLIANPVVAIPSLIVNQTSTGQIVIYLDGINETYSAPQENAVLMGAVIQPLDYIVNASNGIYYSMYGDNGSVAFSGTEFNVVMNSTISSLPDNGGLIKLKCGEYLLPSNYSYIYIPKNNVVVEGQGECTTINLKDSNVYSPVFWIEGVSHGVELRNMQIYALSVYRSTTPTAKEVHGVSNTPVRINNSQYVTVDNLHIYGDGTYGIFLDKSDHNTISNNIVEDAVNSGIYLQDGNDNKLKNNEIISIVSGHGVYLEFDNGNEIIDTNCHDFYTPNMGCVRLNASNYNKIVGTKASGLDVGVYLRNSSWNNIGLSELINVVRGIRIETGEGKGNNNNSVSQNLITATTVGVNILDGSNDNHVATNTITITGLVLANSGGIRVADSSRNFIDSNKITGSALYGINIINYGAVNTLVSNNDLMWSAPLSNSGTSTSFGAGNRCNNGTWGTGVC